MESKAETYRRWVKLAQPGFVYREHGMTGNDMKQLKMASGQVGRPIDLYRDWLTEEVRWRLEPRDGDWGYGWLISDCLRGARKERQSLG